MTDGQNVMNGLIQGMKGLVVGSLSDALNELEMLHSSPICSGGVFSGPTSIRQSPGSSYRNANNALRWRSRSINGTDSLSSCTSKENVGETSSPFSVPRSSNGRISAKIMHSRIGRSRVTPYSNNRRPLYSLTGRSSSCSRLGCSRRVSSFSNTNARSNSDPVCDYAESHHSNSLSPNFMISESRIISYPNCTVKPLGLLSFGILNGGLKLKTVNCSDSFPVPILTKSKSLEDLRESAKPKIKSLSSDMTSGSISSFEASSLTSSKSYHSNRIASTGLKVQQNSTSLYRKNTESGNFIHQEIDSMSALIQGLDVV